MSPRPFFQRFPQAYWFVLGLLVALAAFWVETNWLEIFSALLGRPLSWDTRPAGLRVVMSLIGWMPWIVLAVVIAARIQFGRMVRPVSYFAGVAALNVAAWGVLLLGPAVDDHRHRQAFEPAAWRSNPAPDPSWPARLRMVDDLLRRHDLHGLTRPQVERLLGPADDTEYFREWDMVYWLGPERGLFGIDSEWLVVRLGPAGRVTDYRIVTD